MTIYTGGLACLKQTIIEASNLNQGDKFPKNLTSNPIAAEMAGRILTQVGRPWIGQ